MSLVSLSEVKKYFWITDTSQDAVLQSVFIPNAESIVEWVIGDIATWDKTETINCCDVDYRNDGQHIALSNIQVTGVKTVNWTAYTDDLKILPPNKRRVRLKNLSNYLTSWEPYFDIVYTSWYTADNMPKEIKQVVLTIISLLRWQENGREVKSYKVWDVTVQFDDSANTQVMVTNINNILARYKTFSL